MPDDIAQYICELVVLADILQGDRIPIPNSGDRPLIWQHLLL